MTEIEINNNRLTQIKLAVLEKVDWFDLIVQKAIGIVKTELIYQDI